jgi:hypothetical protein
MKNSNIIGWISLILVIVLTTIVALIQIQKNNVQNINDSETIPLSGEGIIQGFNDNYVLFSDISRSFEVNHALYVCYKMTDGVGILKDNNHIDYKNVDVGNKVLYVLNDLAYDAIRETSEYVVFGRQIAGFERGIIYAKNEFHESSNNRFELQLIKGNWYYYEYQNEYFLKEDIINDFNANYELFCKTVGILDNEHGYFFCYYRPGQLTAMINAEEISIKDYANFELIRKIIYNLGFEVINEEQGRIDFVKQSIEPDKGIIYAEDKLDQKICYGNKFVETTLIRDHWYYFKYLSTWDIPMTNR